MLINGVISQVHADIILGKDTQSVGAGGRASPFLSVPSPGPGLKEMGKTGQLPGLT